MRKVVKYRAYDNLQGGKFEYWDSKSNKFDGIFWSMIKHKSFEEVQQYTGLKDKNKKEIYKGDVIRVLMSHSDYNKTNFEVILKDGAFQMSEKDSYRSTSFAYYFKTATDNGEDTTDKNLYSFFEIIGNIYENPELLK